MRGHVLIIGTVACLLVATPLVLSQSYEDEGYSTEFRENLLPAQQGDPQAQIFVGYLYETGQGVKQNYTKAAEWYRKAAEQGNPVAQQQLGTMYRNGKGVPQSYVLAYMWFDLACRQGSAKARQLRDDVSMNMSSSQIKEAKRISKEWKPKK
ncbi:MAG: tetratricopeptide repeat protein [Desulfomonilia bacterium]